ncbi:unnamed protein product [Lactuca saligna]|uniref:Uncharacterized protein n=1 Tax=Lactuca saligna TaxID=75948 RepID=A0AA36A3L4_LACSI|nr:unnamed protein product [Lactuca saligna]
MIVHRHNRRRFTPDAFDVAECRRQWRQRRGVTEAEREALKADQGPTSAKDLAGVERSSVWEDAIFEGKERMEVINVL